MRLNISKISKILVCCTLLGIASNCKKDSYFSYPESEVNATYSIATELSGIGMNMGMVCPTRTYQGVKGLIVYKSDVNEFIAYDRLCTNYPNDTAALLINDSTYQDAYCPKCKSKFSLIYGFVTRGPAKYSLIKYQTSVSGNFLYITN